MPKIFGIGLSKTGTTSLNAALNTLGIRTVVTNARWPVDIESEAATHESIPAHFEELDQRYPHSRFIYTVRNKKAWLGSIEHSWKVHRDRGSACPEWVERLYGMPNWQFDRYAFSAAYDRHHQRVTAYFAGRDDLLVMNVANGDGWDKLCPFLHKPIPPSAFPRENTGPKRTLFHRIAKKTRRAFRTQVKEMRL